MPTIEVIKDRNLGNSPNTYWKGSGERQFCVKVGGELLRDGKGRVRRFKTFEAAEKAGSK